MAVVFPALPFAAEPAEDPAGQAYSDSDEDRRRLVANNLPLTPSESGQFWPVYEHYQNDLTRLVERRKLAIGKFGENFDEMSDAMARQLTLESIELQEARIKLMKSYFPRFEKVLPAKKLVRYYQIEIRIRTAVDAAIAARIPLVK